MKSSLLRVLACALALSCADAVTARQQSAPSQQQQQSAPSQQPASPSQPASSSASDEVVQVNTRVVFLDALVTDKKTRTLASDLTAENFEVLADGQPRPLSYFTREGDAARRPLALTLVFDLERMGAGRYLRRTEILEAMAAELSKLPASDEVAVVVLDPAGQEGKREWLTGFTRNRAQTASALALIPTLVAAGTPGDFGRGGGPGNSDDEDAASPAETSKGGAQGVEAAASEIKEGASKDGASKDGAGARAKDARAQADDDAAREREAERIRERERQNERGVTVSTDDGNASITRVTLTAKSVEEMRVQLEDYDKRAARGGGRDEVDRYVDKKGRVSTRTLKADGTLLVQRVSPKDGSVEVDVYDDSDLPLAAFEVARRTARERPNSQGAIVYVTDGITLMAYAEREYVEHKMLRQNLIFNALVTDMKTGFKLAKPLLAPLGNWAGLNIYGGAQHIAKESGGEALRVRRPSDYAEGLARIIGNLKARYSLGFTLADAEQDDGRVHTLKVRVRARDAKGKERRLEVKTRAGYFMPTAPPAKPQTATN